jgi:iron(III) transport system substrate-binding protein
MTGKTKILALLAAALLAPPVFGQQVVTQSAHWQTTWDATLAAAKREGKVVIVGTPKPTMRNEIAPKFTARYGIPVEFVAGKSEEMAERVRIERASGIYSVDVQMTGPDTALNVLYPEKLIDPLRPVLILPEVTDVSKWKAGKLQFMDPENQYILRLFSTVDSLIYINAAYVKPQEIHAAKDLLDPKWRGRIATEDPKLDSGAGGNKAALFYSQLGPDFVRKLYVDQKPVISRDRRQMIDWLARGTYPICLSCRPDDAAPLVQDGFKLQEVYRLSDMRNFVNSSPFLLTLANKAPHPNAARVFVNWMATKEALEIYSRSYQAATLRNDVEESFLDPRAIPTPGVEYPDDADPKWRSLAKLEAGKQIRELLKR